MQKNEIEKLAKIIHNELDDFIAWGNALQLSRIILGAGYSKPQPNAGELLPLDEYELYETLSDYAVLPTHVVNVPEQRKELSKFICAKFGTRILSTQKDEISALARVLWKLEIIGHIDYCPDYWVPLAKKIYDIGYRSPNA